MCGETNAAAAAAAAAQTQVFDVLPDERSDVYHLYRIVVRCGDPSSSRYVGAACVPDMKTSVLLNSIFRQQQQSDEDDEEDDEEEERVRPGKVVDLTRNVRMVCRHDPRFGRWVPMRRAP